LNNCTPLNIVHPCIQPIHHYYNVCSLKYIRNQRTYSVDIFYIHLTKLYGQRILWRLDPLQFLTNFLTFISINNSQGRPGWRNYGCIDHWHVYRCNYIILIWWIFLIMPTWFFMRLLAVCKISLLVQWITFGANGMWLSSFSGFHPQDWPFFLIGCLLFTSWLLLLKKLFYFYLL
jgi:hypothetical protein